MNRVASQRWVAMPDIKLNGVTYQVARSGELLGAIPSGHGHVKPCDFVIRGRTFQEM